MFLNLLQHQKEYLPDHLTISMSECVGQGAVDKETHRPSHPGSPITNACLLCLQLFCPECMEDIGGCSQGESCVIEITLMR
mgnify:CR=1 FL=1